MLSALRLVGLVTVAGLLSGVSQPGASIEVMSSGGFSAAYQELSTEYSDRTEIALNTVYGASLGGAPTSIPNRLDRGEFADVVILASEGLDRLVARGHVVATSRVDLASSLIGMAVRSGEATPDIGTVEAFTRTLLDAESIAYSASASGTYLSTQLFSRLGIAARVAPKSTRVVGEQVGAVVARGEAAIGFQQVSELLPIEGITYVGAIPTELQKITVFSAALTTRARDVDAARALIEFLASPKAAPAIARTGMEPLVEGWRSVR